MVVFPDSKINLGLNIVNKRPDGYHNIQSIMVPIGWTDVLEVTPSPSGHTTLNISGRPVNCPPEKNLVMKALRRVEQLTGSLPAVDIYLRKIVPDGAGLGGGSADAAAMVNAIDSLFALGLKHQEKLEICSDIGADCPMFLNNSPMIASGTGTTLEPVEIPALKGMKIIVSKPDTYVSTAEAYAGVVPTKEEWNLRDFAALPASEWRHLLRNTFEDSIFPSHPEIKAIKDYFYSCGAVYASMSGSGAAVYGLFSGDILADLRAQPLAGAAVWTGSF